MRLGATEFADRLATEIDPEAPETDALEALAEFLLALSERRAAAEQIETTEATTA
jgi:hypothetical protein